MSFYSDLGVEPIINAAATLTAIGGSIMPDDVIAAMQDSAKCYVDMTELQKIAGDHLAKLTKNEAAYVTPGCAAGLVLATLACITRGDPGRISRMPRGKGLPKEVVMFCGQRIPYDRAIELAGGRIRQIGNSVQTFPWELEEALSHRTAAVLFVAGSHLTGGLSLADTIAIARSKNVPVVVDAAAQLPPVENLWHFTSTMGADLVLFSGGKALRGPQASGLMVGKEILVDAARANASPNQRFARAMKAGKEEIAGLVCAVERFLDLDHESLSEQYEVQVSTWIDALSGFPGVEPRRSFPNEAGQPVPRLELCINPQVAGFSASEIQDELFAGKPRIAVLRVRDSIYITPDTIMPGEASIISETVQALIRGYMSH